MQLFRKRSGVAQLGIAALLWMSTAARTAADDKSFPILERRTAVATILDPDGKPVVGAKVTPRALRARGHGAWRPEMHGEVKTTVTDDQGQTIIEYPPTFDAVNMVTSINILIDHPDFCVTDFALPASATAENSQGTTRLDRGTKVRIQVFDSVATHPSDQVHVSILARSAAMPPGKRTLFELQKPSQVAGAKAGPKNTADDHWYESRRLPATARRLVAIVLQEDDVPLFSPVLRWAFDDPIGQTILTTVEPGVRFEGVLDDAVPRPVKSGRVVAMATTPPKDASEEWACTVWQDVVDIRADGTFFLASMPRGCDLQIVAICDGWRSEVPDEAQRYTFAAKYDSQNIVNDSRANPQTWTLEGEVLKGTVRMTPTATCHVRCLDRDQKPLPGLRVGFSPNHYFPGAGSWLFAVSGRSIDAIKTGEFRSTTGEEDYRGVTNDEGVAVICNLPPGKQRFGVLQGKRQMALERADDGYVTPLTDRIVETTVTVIGPSGPEE